MTKREVVELQKDMNSFTGRFLEDFPRLRVDGVRGHATNRRIQTCKYYIGYDGKTQRSSRVTQPFRRRLDHPKGETVPETMRRRGERRRRKQRHEAQHPQVSKGVVLYDGRPCAAWLVPYLDFARNHGWDGVLNSGWRDPERSEQLCLQMCGAKTCPGRCAGRSSNHSGSEKPMGAIDVSFYTEFGQLMRRPDAPRNPPIFNALGAQDPVHFSATGR